VTSQELQSRYDRPLQAVLFLQEEIADIHPLLERLFPIALVEGDQFYVFDVDATSGPERRRYTFVLQAPTPMPIPQGVRAAFPLACYRDRPACVVSGDVFHSIEGYVMVFHEFVHCQQWDTCEARLKQTLGIARQAQAENDIMWEIDYPFPYGDPDFVETYLALLDAAWEGRLDDIRASRRRLREALDQGDWEYMVWQEWKEGLARYIENQIRGRLGLRENHGGQEPPFNRVTFYEGGSRQIAALGQHEPGLLQDIEALFHRLYGGAQPKAGYR
jgi:hypothetical protein